MIPPQGIGELIVPEYKEGKGLIRREQAGHAQYTPGKCLLKNGNFHCADVFF